MAAAMTDDANSVLGNGTGRPDTSGKLYDYLVKRTRKEERAALVQLLRDCGGDMRLAAKTLGRLNGERAPKVLYNWVNRHGLLAWSVSLRPPERRHWSGSRKKGPEEVAVERERFDALLASYGGSVIRAATSIGRHPSGFRKALKRLGLLGRARQLQADRVSGMHRVPGVPHSV